MDIGIDFGQLSELMRASFAHRAVEFKSKIKPKFLVKGRMLKPKVPRV